MDDGILSPMSRRPIIFRRIVCDLFVRFGTSCFSCSGKAFAKDHE